MYIKLLTAVCDGNIIYFDGDGRIYEFNPILQQYVGTEKFVHLDYFGIPIRMMAPEYVIAGGYNPIIDEVTFEDITSDE